MHAVDGIQRLLRDVLLDAVDALDERGVPIRDVAHRALDAREQPLAQRLARRFVVRRVAPDELQNLFLVAFHEQPFRLGLQARRLEAFRVQLLHPVDLALDRLLLRLCLVLDGLHLIPERVLLVLALPFLELLRALLFELCDLLLQLAAVVVVRLVKQGLLRLVDRPQVLCVRLLPVLGLRLLVDGVDLRLNRFAGFVRPILPRLLRFVQVLDLRVPLLFVAGFERVDDAFVQAVDVRFLFLAQRLLRLVDLLFQVDAHLRRQLGALRDFLELLQLLLRADLPARLELGDVRELLAKQLLLGLVDLVRGLLLLLRGLRVRQRQLLQQLNLLPRADLRAAAQPFDPAQFVVECVVLDLLARLVDPLLHLAPLFLGLGVDGLDMLEHGQLARVVDLIHGQQVLDLA